MARRIWIAERAKAAFDVDAARSPKVEVVSVLIGNPDTLDVYAVVPVTDSNDRSRTHVSVEVSAGTEQATRKTLSKYPGSAVIGHVHDHLVAGLSTPSSVDLAQFNELARHPSKPTPGWLELIASVRPELPLLWRGWVIPAPQVLDEVELCFTLDPHAARARDDGSDKIPVLSEHALGTVAGARRFSEELASLSAREFTTTYQVRANGVEVEISHRAQVGTLVLTLPPEGWHLPPRVERRTERGTVHMLVSSMSALLSSWSSAMTLSDLVLFVVNRELWPRRNRDGYVPSQIPSRSP